MNKDLEGLLREPEKQGIHARIPGKGAGFRDSISFFSKIGRKSLEMLYHFKKEHSEAIEEIYLKMPFDYEEPSKYDFIVHIKTSNGISGRTIAELHEALSDFYSGVMMQKPGLSISHTITYSGNPLEIPRCVIPLSDYNHR